MKHFSKYIYEKLQKINSKTKNNNGMDFEEFINMLDKKFNINKERVDEYFCHKAQIQKMHFYDINEYKDKLNESQESIIEALKVSMLKRLNGLLNYITMSYNSGPYSLYYIDVDNLHESYIFAVWDTRTTIHNGIKYNGMFINIYLAVNE